MGWKHDFLQRLKSDWLLKQIGTAVGMSAFFIAYFLILKHPLKPVTIMPLTPVDSWVGFEPAALLLYVSLWIYIPLLPALIRGRSALLRYAFGAVVLSVVGLALFLLLPTATPAPDVDFTAFQTMAFLKTVDAAGNACPSLHVAFAVYNLAGFECFFWRLRSPWKLRVLNLCWALGIVYSTLAVKQHVFFDVLAGTVLGALCAWITFAPWRSSEADL